MKNQHSARRRTYLELDIHRTCTRCRQRKPISKGCKCKPFVCSQCVKAA